MMRPTQRPGAALASAFLVAALAATLLTALAPVRADDEPTGDPRLSAEERATMQRMLDESRERFRELISGLSEEQWSWKPAPDRWSVGECAEHIVKSEAALLASAEEALAKPPDPAWQEKTKGKSDFIQNVMPNRTRRAVAPQEIRPTEGMSHDEVLAEHERIRTRVRAVLADEDREFKNHLLTHPFPVFGDLNAYDWLIYVPLHTIRHSKQIAEVQQTEGYPQ